MEDAFDRPWTLAELQAAYRQGLTTPSQVIQTLTTRIAAEEGHEAWILLRDLASVMAEADAATAALQRDPGLALRQPLLGVPFAVKDNIDVGGLVTTGACPAFGKVAAQDATAVARLRAAGAIPLGKTNLDQFATGLVGTRSPYGAVRNPFHPAYMSGGSSSGSAAATARGWVVFALGTDTAGSGRVPAGACNLVGIKPTPGLVSAKGVLPACRSLDCVSIFAHTVEDGWQVLQVLAGHDPEDAYSRQVLPIAPPARQVRIGIPASPEFYGDAQAQAAWDAAVRALRADPDIQVGTFSMTPFSAVARLLYEGPWVAERRAALGEFYDQHSADMDPTVRTVIGQADRFNAVETFQAQYELARLRSLCAAEMAEFDLLVVPTAPSIYRHDAIAAEPVTLNSRLGTYTNFVNLLGMAAVALPGPFREDGLPAGITLLGPGGSDHRLAELARRWQPALHQRLGLTGQPPPYQRTALTPLPAAEPSVEVAVVGAHLAGLPLNWQLTERSAQLRETTCTAPAYRLYALPDSTPPKPGLVHVGAGGHAIEVEIWSLPTREFGSFVAGIPAPLGIGTLVLADGRRVQGFLCESSALSEATDIGHYGGWRAYLASQEAANQTPNR